MRHRERDYKDWYSMTGSDETTTETTSWSWWDYSRQNKRNLSCNRCREKVRRNKREQEQEWGGQEEVYSLQQRTRCMLIATVCRSTALRAHQPHPPILLNLGISQKVEKTQKFEKRFSFHKGPQQNRTTLRRRVSVD